MLSTKPNKHKLANEELKKGEEKSYFFSCTQKRDTDELYTPTTRFRARAHQMYMFILEFTTLKEITLNLILINFIFSASTAIFF